MVHFSSPFHVVFRTLNCVGSHQKLSWLVVVLAGVAPMWHAQCELVGILLLRSSFKVWKTLPGATWRLLALASGEWWPVLLGCTSTLTAVLTALDGLRGAIPCVSWFSTLNWPLWLWMPFKNGLLLFPILIYQEVLFTIGCAIGACVFPVWDGSFLFLHSAFEILESETIGHLQKLLLCKLHVLPLSSNFSEFESLTKQFIFLNLSRPSSLVPSENKACSGWEAPPVCVAVLVMRMRLQQRVGICVGCVVTVTHSAQTLVFLFYSCVRVQMLGCMFIRIHSHKVLDQIKTWKFPTVLNTVTFVLKENFVHFWDS